MADIDGFLAIHGWSENTRDRYGRALRTFINEIQDPENLTAAAFDCWLKSHSWGNSAQWIAFVAVRGYLRWEYGGDHPALALKLKRHKSPPQRTLDMNQVRQLLFSFDTGIIKGRRDLAMACVFIDSGLRVSEMCSLKLSRLDIDHLRLAVVGKGGDWQQAAFSPYTANCLMTWMASRDEIARPGINNVFVSVGGMTPGMPLTRHGLQRVVKDWGKKSSIGKLSPHDFRRTFATIMTRLGAPTRITMLAGRWGDEEMVKRYTRSLNLDDVLVYSPIMAAMR